MEAKNNLNFKIETHGGLFGSIVSKFSFWCFVIFELIVILLIFLPLLFASNLLITLIVSGSLSLFNILSTFKWPFLDTSLYEAFNHFIRYKLDIQELNAQNLIQKKLKFQSNNMFVYQYENKLLFKSYFEISVINPSDSKTEYSIVDWETILQENNVRIFSINSSFQVKDNIDKFTQLISQEIDFKKDDILANNKNKLLLQQLAEFTILNESIDEHSIHIIEFNREYIIDPKLNIKDLISSSLSNYKIDESAFRTNLTNIAIKELNETYLEAVKSQILNFKNKQIKIKYKSIEEIENEKHTYYRFIKVNELSPLLEPYYLFPLFNNSERYETSISFTSLTDKDEDRIYDYIDRNVDREILKRKQRRSKMSKRASIIRKEQTALLLDEMLEEITTSNSKSKALSILVKIKSNSIKELNRFAKEFKSFYRKQRIKFVDLTFLQKQALLDFHIGTENRLNRKGKERKQWIIKRKFNNVNMSTLWLTANSCAYALPIKTSIDIESTGWIFGEDLNNNPIALDFDLNRPNHHIAIFGMSGSGKTTASEYLLNQKLVKTCDKESVVIIIDPKNEYANIVKEYEGQTFNLSEGFANPFIRNSTSENIEDNEFISQFLFNLLKPLKDIEINLVVINLLKMIYSSEEWKQNIFNFDHLIKKIKEDKSFKNKLKDDYVVILDYLSQYGSKGIKSHLFNTKTNVEFNKKIISFNFQKLIGDNLNNDTSVLILNVLHYINNLMKKNDPKFKQNQKFNITILVDEFHLLVNANDTLIIKQFDALYSISRSFGVGIITATQNLSSLNSPNIVHHAKSIFSNSAYLISFYQSKSEFEHFLQLIPENIEITDYEKEEILSDKKHQSLIFNGKNKKFMKWKLGLFYNPDRDENADGFKSVRISQYEYLKDIVNKYIEIRKEEINE